MRPVLYRLTSYCVLLIFAGFSLLGSAGTHELFGVSHDGHAHHGHWHSGDWHHGPAHTPVAPGIKVHGCGHDHSHHTHNALLSQVPEDRTAPSHQDTPGSHDCQVCDWFAQSLAPALPSLLLPLLESLTPRSLTREVVLAEHAVSTPPVRGPPARIGSPS